jgi:membrane protein implicated in regulation of membrane protease activity
METAKCRAVEECKMMTWDASTVWWATAGVLVVLELASGTFYLLMLALGAAFGALAAHAGLAFPAQLISAAVAANPDLQIDIGATVRVTHWGADGRTRVHYRGAQWDARQAGPGLPQPGDHVVEAVQGNVLVLRHDSPR